MIDEEKLRDWLGGAELRLLGVLGSERAFVVEARCGHISEQSHARSLEEAICLAQQKLEVTLVQYNEATNRTMR